jgi:ATP-dependent helicase/nuclease subunit A
MKMVTQQTKPEQWTDEQWQAITQRGQNLLVAAAAGSGKTSVLVERIIRRITDPAEPVGVDQLLVVTFTNAAAAEMRHRIGDALRKALEAAPHSAHLRRQLALLPRATITTLHSFCLGLLRQYYYLVELDPDFRIADQMEAELLRQDVLEAKLEEWYERDADFHALADVMLDGQDDGSLARMLLRLHDFSRSHPEPSSWLEQAAGMFEVEEDQPLSSLPWTPVLLQSIRLQLQALEAALQKAAGLAASAEGPGAYLPLLQQEQASLARARHACERGWEELELAVRAIQFQKLPPVKDADPLVKEQAQALRNGVKEGVKKLLEEYFLTPAEEYIRALRRCAPYMKTLARLVNEYDHAYRQEKRGRALVDFSDLEHLALQILLESDEQGTPHPSAVARQLRQQFAEVLVDEYQDINLVQETILRMVSRDREAGVPSNRFMVGDVKQSIYRFRLAEPRLFLEKYQTYEKTPAGNVDGSAAADGVRIDLAANFRSRREVVDAVNFLFRQIMSPGVGEIAYDKSAELICRASYPEVEPERLQVEVHLIDRQEPEHPAGGSDEAAETEQESDAENGTAAELQEEANAAQLEARLIARRIRRWMEPGEGEPPLLVYDKQAGGLRPLAYRDIVILLRATAGWGETMLEEFRAAGIPVYVEQSGGYFAATEVELMLSLLRVIDNPLQDIPLAAVLRSPIVGISEEQLAQIRIHYPSGPFHQAVNQYVAEQCSDTERWHRRLRRFFHRLEEWRTRARQGSLAELISQIYRETGYLDYVATLANGQQRQANLRALYDRAKQYEAGSYRGLFRFLRFVDRLQQSGSDLGEARTIGESEDVVRVMTIHKSKGLEFPVVFVAGLGKQFNTMDMKSSFLLHKDLGFGPLVTDPELQLRYPSFAYLGIKQQLQREMLAEEMRVLYVALTRAREKLILVGSAKDLSKSVTAWGNQTGEGKCLADEDLIQAKGYLDWIGRALLRHPSAAPLRAYPHMRGGEAVNVGTIPDDSLWSFHFHQAGELELAAPEPSDELILWQRIINREQIEDRPKDEVWREVIERKLSWQDPQPYASQTAAKWSVSDLGKKAAGRGGMPVELPKITQKPRFLSGLESHRFSGAEVGTIMHTVMQHIDVTGPLDEADIRRQIAALVQRQHLTEEQAQAVNVQQIAAFFASPLGNRMKRAVVIHRELPFTLAVPASEIGEEFAAAAEERIIVQGVIDCLLEEADGKLTLIDFKTDRIAAEAASAAAAQLTERYGGQIRYYVRAVEQIWRRKVQESYLYVFSGGFAIPIKQ